MVAKKKKKAGVVKKATKKATKKAAKTKAVVKRKKPARKGAKKVGRPLEFTPKLGERICNFVAKGETWDEFLVRPGMPSRRALCLYLSKIEEFRNQYAQACEARAEGLIGKIYKEIDELDAISKKTKHVKDGTFSLPDEAAWARMCIQACRAKIDIFKWLAAKFYPRMYGKKLEVTASVSTPKYEYDYTLLSEAELTDLRRLLHKAKVKPVLSV